MSKKIPNATPSRAECAKVSPKYDILRHTTKAPNGAVIKESKIPVSQAGKIISNIIYPFIFQPDACSVAYVKRMCSIHHRAYRVCDYGGEYKGQCF